MADNMSLSTRGMMIAGVIILIAVAGLVYVAYRWGKKSRPPVVHEQVLVKPETVRVLVPGDVQYVTRTRVVTREVPDSVTALEVLRVRRALESAEARLAELGMGRVSIVDTTVETTVTVTEASTDTVIATQVVRATIRAGYDFPPVDRHVIEYQQDPIRVRAVIGTAPARSPDQLSWWDRMMDGYKTGSAYIVAAAVVGGIVYVAAGK